MKTKITFSKQKGTSKNSTQKIKLNKEEISQIEELDKIKGGAIASSGCYGTRGTGVGACP